MLERAEDGEEVMRIRGRQIVEEISEMIRLDWYIEVTGRAWKSVGGVVVVVLNFRFSTGRRMMLRLC